MPGWLTKALKIVGKITDVLIRGRAAGLWYKKAGPNVQNSLLGSIKPSWDPFVSIRKGLTSFLRMIGAAVVFAIVGVLNNSQEINHLFVNAGLPDYAAALFAMGSVAAGKALANAWTHFTDEPEVIEGQE